MNQLTSQIILVGAFLVMCANGLLADVLITNSGSRYEGSVERDRTGAYVVTRASGGKMTFPAEMVKEVVKGNAPSPNPSSPPSSPTSPPTASPSDIAKLQKQLEAKADAIGLAAAGEFPPKGLDMPSLAGFTLTPTQVQQVREIADEMSGELDAIISQNSRPKLLEWTQRFMLRVARDVYTPEQAVLTRPLREAFLGGLARGWKLTVAPEATIKLPARPATPTTNQTTICKVPLCQTVPGLIDGTIVFSSDGSRAGFLARSDGMIRVYVDGKAGTPHTDVGKPGLMFSPSGRRTAYFAGPEGEVVFVLDGTPQPGLVFTGVATQSIAISKDETHISYVARTAEGWIVVNDGKVSPPFERVGHNRVSEVGSTFAYVAKRPGGWYAYIDGAASGPYAALGAIYLSANGKRHGYLVGVDAEAKVAYAVIDGQRGPTYNCGLVPDTITFSPDGERVAYFANRDGKFYANVDGVEQGPYDGIAEGPTFSADGKHLIYAAQMGTTWTVVRDGKPGARHTNLGPESIRLSADGTKLVYAASDNGRWRVITEGKPGPTFPALLASGPYFTADGSTVLYAASTGAGAGASAIIIAGGRQFGPYKEIGPLVMSPTGCGFAAWVKTAAGWSILRDGTIQPASFDGFVEDGLQYSADGTRLAGIAARGSKRVMIVNGVESTPFDNCLSGVLRVPDDPAGLCVVAYQPNTVYRYTNSTKFPNGIPAVNTAPGASGHRR